jgi:hypothetical protein
MLLKDMEGLAGGRPFLFWGRRIDHTWNAASAQALFSRKERLI